jgi:hypothetical protein
MEGGAVYCVHMKQSTDNKNKGTSVAKSLLSTKGLNEVTSTSRVLSAVIFICLPFIGFAIGFASAGGVLGGAM